MWAPPEKNKKKIKRWKQALNSGTEYLVWVWLWHSPTCHEVYRKLKFCNMAHKMLQELHTVFLSNCSHMRPSPQPPPPLSPPQSHHPEQASHSLNLIFAQLTFLIWHPFSLRAPFTFPWKHLSLCVTVQLCNYSFDFSLPY